MQEPAPDSRALVERLEAYCFPGGNESARGVRGIQATQRGTIRSGPEARWNPFTAEEFVDATSSAFRWEAKMGGGLVTSVHVTDAYKNGHGRLTVKKGPIQLTKLVGPDVDKGELQRYLGYVFYCPAILLNNPSLELTAIGPLTLRVSDRLDQTGAWVDVDLAENGCPRLVRALRPMTVGKHVVLTPWSASGTEPEVQDGLRIPRRMEACWSPPEGAYTYIRIELTSVTILH